MRRLQPAAHELRRAAALQDGNSPGQPEKDRRPGTANPPADPGLPAVPLPQQERVPGARRRGRLLQESIAPGGRHSALPPAAGGGRGIFPRRRAGLSATANAQLQVVSDGREIAARLETPGAAEKWFSPERTVRFAIGPFAYRVAPDNFIQANLFQLQPLQGLLGSTWAQGRSPGPRTFSAAAAFSACPWRRAAARCWPWRTTRATSPPCGRTWN